MTTLTAVVADDEPLGRRGIVARLERSDRVRVRVLAECADGRSAVDAVTRLSPDVLFLDVRMPDLDGFGVLEALPKSRRPHVIFVTAYDRHAVDAFRVRALDYLVKPIDDERFAEALERAREVVQRASGSTSAPAFSIRDRGRVTRIPHAEIDWIEAQGDYACLHAGPREHLLRETMGSLEGRLDGRFLRIHRSAIVNADRVRELRSRENGDFRVILQSGAELRLSRTRRQAVDRLTRRPG